MKDLTRSLLVSALLVALPTLAHAGPTLLCFPLSIGPASSLPWAAGSWNSPSPHYDRTRLIDDTLTLLAPSTSTLARMETIRRATIYASADATLSARLIDALRARVVTTGTTPADPYAAFDLGYAIEAMRQAQHTVKIPLPVPADNGYELLRQSLTARPRDAAMHYAAALMTVPASNRATSDVHLRSAIDGARHDANLARTLDAHAELWGGRLASARTAASR